MLEKRETCGVRAIEVIDSNTGRERQECVAETGSKARYLCNPDLSPGLGRRLPSG